MANSTFNQEGSNTSVNCHSGVVVGDWLYMDATNTAQKAQADDLVKSRVIGVCVEKTSSTVAVVALPGDVATIFSGLDTTKEYFLSSATPGAMVTDSGLPTTAGHVILTLGRPLSATEFLVVLGTRIVLS